MIITDTHTHLYSEAFEKDQDEMMSRALQAGVSRFFVPAIDSTYTESMYDLERKYPNYVFLMMGLHPTHVKEDYKQELTHVKTALEQRKFVAVGEIGIDLYWDQSTLKQQQDAFRMQIQWAKEYKLPIVIHCRDAFDEIFDILEEEQSDDLFGIFHCFTGTLVQARRAIDLNMLLGIGGVVTFRNSGLAETVAQISLDNLVLETDAPYLAPMPHRGKRNESSYLPLIATKLAETHNVSVSEIVKITTENAKRLFEI